MGSMLSQYAQSSAALGVMIYINMGHLDIDVRVQLAIYDKEPGQPGRIPVLERKSPVEKGQASDKILQASMVLVYRPCIHSSMTGLGS